MVVFQDYSGLLQYYALPTATIDTGADYILFLDATDGAIKRGLPPAGGGGGGVSDGDKGDITVTSSGTVWTIDNGAVTLAKMANMATASLLGRNTSGTGVPEVLSASTARSLLGLATVATSASASDLTSGTLSTSRLPTIGTAQLGSDITTAGKALLDDADAAAQRTTLGLGTLATQNGTFSGTSSGTNTGDQTITLTGDVTGSGTGSFAATLANSGVTANTYASPSSVTVDAKGRITAITAGSGGDILYSVAPNTTTSIASVTAVELVNKSLTLAVGDIVEVEMWGTLLNNSAATRTYTPSMVLTVGVNTLTLTCTDGTTVGASGTNRAYWRVKAWFTVASTSATQGMMESDRAPGAAANSPQSIAATTNRKVWNTSSSNMTGSATIQIRFQSDNATATQQFTVYGYQFRKKAQVT